MKGNLTEEKNRGIRGRDQEIRGHPFLGGMYWDKTKSYIIE